MDLLRWYWYWAGFTLLAMGSGYGITVTLFGDSEAAMIVAVGALHGGFFAGLSVLWHLGAAAERDDEQPVEEAA